MTIVKICGVRTFDDAFMAAELGADLLGFNFYKRSPRYIAPEVAQPICDALREHLGEACPALVGIFVNEPVSSISLTMSQVGLDFAQLSGDESADMLKELRGRAFKSIRPTTVTFAQDDVTYFSAHFPQDERAPSLLLDANHAQLYGGTGVQASDQIALTVRERVPRLMLAGGLNPENVAARIQAVQPWGVDVASGVEPSRQPGVKDPVLVRAFIEAARGA